jgi:hypothetical protein
MENIGISDLSLWQSIAERRSVLLTRAALLIIFCVLFAVGAQAQTFRGAINGAVTDPAGAAVAGAQVKILEIATGVEHSGLTTSDGEFSFQDLPLGYYKVTVTATGFPPFAVDKVEVVAGQIYTLSVKLKLETQATTVEITADSLSMNTTTATRTRFHTVDRHTAWIWRVRSWRFRFTERNAAQSDELADRRCGQQRFLA